MHIREFEAMLQLRMLVGIGIIAGVSKLSVRAEALLWDGCRLCSIRQG